MGAGKTINTEFSDFLEIQTRTAWGRALADFADWCSPAAGTLLLDLGCGPGLLPALFTRRFGCRALGLDYDLALLSSAENPVVCADASLLPFAPASFDVVTATNVIFLLRDPLSALRECRRILKSDGTLALLNPSEHLNQAAAAALADARNLDGKNRASLLGWAKRAEKHGGWSEAHTRNLLRRAGFSLCETRLMLGPGFARLARARPLTTPARVLQSK